MMDDKVLTTHLSAVLLQLGRIHSFQNRFHRLALTPPAADTVRPYTVFMLQRAPLFHLRTVSLSHKFVISSHVQNINCLQLFFTHSHYFTLLRDVRCISHTVIRSYGHTAPPTRSCIFRKERVDSLGGLIYTRQTVRSAKSTGSQHRPVLVVRSESTFSLCCYVLILAMRVLTLCHRGRA